VSLVNGHVFNIDEHDQQPCSLLFTATRQGSKSGWYGRPVLTASVVWLNYVRGNVSHWQDATTSGLTIQFNLPGSINRILTSAHCCSLECLSVILARLNSMVHIRGKLYCYLCTCCHELQWTRLGTPQPNDAIFQPKQRTSLAQPRGRHISIIFVNLLTYLLQATVKTVMNLRGSFFFIRGCTKSATTQSMLTKHLPLSNFCIITVARTSTYCSWPRCCQDDSATPSLDDCYRTCTWGFGREETAHKERW
jgi:hypothetical protein